MRSAGRCKRFATFKDQTGQLRLWCLPFHSFYIFLSDDAADAATLCAAAGRAQAASGAVACAASAAVAWAASAAASSGEAGCRANGASRDATAHREGHGKARGQAIALGLRCPYAAQPRMQHQPEGDPSILKGCADEGDGSRTEGASQTGRCGGDAPST